MEVTGRAEEGMQRLLGISLFQKQFESENHFFRECF